MDRLLERLPTPAEYRRITAAVGWSEAMNYAAAEKALAGSLFGVTAVRSGEAVAMGRIVGDGAIYFYLQDIAVVPEHQGRGLGRRVVAALLSWLRENAPDRAFVGLFASAVAQELYREFGFEVRPDLTGMYRVTPIERL